MNKQYCVLYNPLAGCCDEEARQKLRNYLSHDRVRFVDMTTVDDYAAFFHQLDRAERLVLAGGDGTLNHFVNAAKGLRRPSAIYYYACGNGNDFALDIGRKKGDKPMEVSQYLTGLPTVTVNGESHLFINGVGYGIDGYCCKAGDRMHAKGKKSVNYAAIAVKGLLFHYRPVNATVTVDGKRYDYKRVWLAPTMNGRHYGGGMMPTPKQSRLSPQNTVSVMVFHGAGKLRTLCAFPSIFTGKHIRRRNMVEVLLGHHIRVAFDRPTPLQIDGETILNVSGYEVVK